MPPRKRTHSVLVDFGMVPDEPLHCSRAWTFALMRAAQEKRTLCAFISFALLHKEDIKMEERDLATAKQRWTRCSKDSEEEQRQPEELLWRSYAKGHMWGGLRWPENWASIIRRSIGMRQEQESDGHPSAGDALPVRAREGTRPLPVQPAEAVARVHCWRREIEVLQALAAQYPWGRRSMEELWLRILSETYTGTPPCRADTAPQAPL